jgi:glycosyltransferase involved in cell wall biosynthesis
MEISRRLVNLGHNVVLFTSKFSGSTLTENADGVRIVRAGSKYSVHRHAKKFYREESKGSKFDVIIDGINTKPFSAPSFATRGETILALIFQLAREYWFYETPFPIGLIGYFLLEKKWLRPYRDLPTITISKSTQSDLLQLKFSRIFNVPVGTNVPPRPKIPSKADFPLIVFDGRLGKAKRPDHVLKAFRRVKGRIRNAQLWMIGDGPMKGHLLEKAGEGITFFGNVEHLKRIELLEKSWVLVNPSVREGFGINIVNANAVGTPAIGYDVPGLRDSIVPGFTGLLVKNGDTDSLAKAMVNVLSDENLRTYLGKNAFEYSKRFNWDESAKRFIEIIENEKRWG